MPFSVARLRVGEDRLAQDLNQLIPERHGHLLLCVESSRVVAVVARDRVGEQHVLDFGAAADVVHDQRTTSPGLFELITLLGREVSVARIERLVAHVRPQE